MKTTIILSFFVAALTTSRAQSVVGLGVGFDWIESFEADPGYANKDINLSFSHSLKVFQFEVRQGLRYLENFETIRYNTYLLAGLTTPKDRSLVFDFLVGGALSFANQNNQSGYSHYRNQFCPTLKTSIDFRVSAKNRIYLGMDWLISAYTYENTDHLGYPMKTGDLTGSVLLSVKHALK